MSEENEQRLKEYQSNYLRAKKNIKNVFVFVFTWYKMEQKMVFREDFINKSSSQNEITISIDKVDIKRIVLPKIYPYGNKGSFEYSIGYIHIRNLFPIPLCIK